jgi:peptidyl-prolyl cis-trans isomerase B (cyclophilin B)
MRTITLICTVGLLLGVVAVRADEPKKETKPEPKAEEKKPEAKPADKTAEVKEVAVVKTSEGEMVLEFWPDVAPKTVENFKKLAKRGFYDDTASHRMIPGFMVQLGDPNTKDPAKESLYGQGDPGYKIEAEFSERKHVRGVLSMARNGDPMERTGAMPRPQFANTAGSQFFICFGPATSLDGRYTAFGKVVKGDEVLAKIEKIPVGPNPLSGEPSKPKSRIAIESIKIVPADSIK